MKNISKHDNSQERSRETLAGATAGMQPQGTRVNTVTQINPDDVMADNGPMAPQDRNAPPTQRQMEQDVMSVNPSTDSMESRG